MSEPTAAEICRAFNDAPAAALLDLIQAFSADGRSSVIAAVGRARRRLAREQAESERLEGMAELQGRLEASGLALVAGVDEVGRGCLAGPVSAAAVVLPASARIAGINDSKALTPRARVELDARIRSLAVTLAVAHVEPSAIDAVGIAAANLIAMRRAIAGLGVPIDHALVDGLPVDLGVPSTAIVGGDRRVAAIAAASIVAKVARDALMRRFDAEFPEYGFAANKGYGTAEHLAVIARIGPCALHRMSFAPCAQHSLF